VSPGRRLLVDTDAFMLFAGSGILDEVAVLLGFDPAKILRLSALPHMLRGQKMRRSYPPEVIARAAREANRYASLDSETGDPELVDALTGVPGIDAPGDVILLAIAAADRDTYLLTGDKRAVTALGISDDLQRIRDLLSKRIICVERALRLLVEQRTAASVAKSMSDVRFIHQSLKVFFSEENLADDTKCLEAIDHYFHKLSEASGGGGLLFC
jgi:hypothetical protein